MKWSKGNWTSVPDDGRCFIERGNDDLWYVYKTDDEGDLIRGFPKEIEQGFKTVEAAQIWSLEHVSSAPRKRISLSRGSAPK